MNDNQDASKKSSFYLYWSFGLLAFVLVSFILSGVILDSVMASFSLTAQRWIGGLTLALPAVLGTLMGILALRQPGRRLLASVAILLNGFIALFFIALLSLAG